MANIRSAYTDGTSFFGARTPASLAEEFGTPLYVYNEVILRQRCRELVSMCKVPGFVVNYSAKANTNKTMLILAKLALTCSIKSFW